MSTRIYAVYRDPQEMLDAIEQLKTQGYHQLEAYSPYPVAGLAEALGYTRSTISRWVFYVGLGAAGLTYLIQWLLNAYLYPINVGARPPHFPLSYVPICFEVGILSAAITAVAGIFIKGRLWRLWDPVFELPQFASVTRDRYWLELSLQDDATEEASTQALRQTGAREIISAGGNP